MEKNTNDISRFMLYVNKSDTGCWEWTGGKFRDTRYGAFRYLGRAMSAHRVSLLLLSNQDIEGKHVRHTCDNRGCVNPEHLIAGTHQENMDDMVVRGGQCTQWARRQATLTGKNVGLRKLTEEQVKVIWERIQSNEHVACIAKEYQLHTDTIRKIKSGDTWNCVTGLPCPRHKNWA